MKDVVSSFVSSAAMHAKKECLIQNASFAKRCTMRVGGCADALLLPADKQQLCRWVCEAYREGVPYLVLGNGSNLIPGDGDFHGVLFSTQHIKEILYYGTKIKADCGISLNQLVLCAARAGLGGIENLYGIPGTLGGAVKMNAGAHGTEIADVVEEVTMLLPRTGEIRVFSQKEMCFSYRESLLQTNSEWVVLDATLSLVPVSYAAAKKRIAEVVQIRCASQPLNTASAGSFFRRHGNLCAWRLIDECGMRGYVIGDACVSPKHCGFIVNTGRARTADICRLAQLVQRRVMDACGILLKPEVEFFHLSEEEKCHLPIL